MLIFSFFGPPTPTLLNHYLKLVELPNLFVKDKGNCGQREHQSMAVRFYWEKKRKNQFFSSLRVFMSFYNIFFVFSNFLPNQIRGGKSFSFLFFHFLSYQTKQSSHFLPFSLHFSLFPSIFFPFIFFPTPNKGLKKTWGKN